MRPIAVAGIHERYLLLGWRRYMYSAKVSLQGWSDSRVQQHSLSPHNLVGSLRVVPTTV